MTNRTLLARGLAAAAALAVLAAPALLAEPAAATPAVDVAPAAPAAVTAAPTTSTSTAAKLAAAAECGTVDDDGYFCRATTGEYLQGDTPLALANAHEGWRRIGLPFTFPYYGAAHDEVTVSANGYLTFEDADIPPFLGPEHREIPDPVGSNAALFGFYGDLNLSGGGIHTGEVEIDGVPGMVVEYRNAARQWSEDAGTRSFSITLLADGRVIYGYGPGADSSWMKGAAAAIGWENHSGTVGGQYSFREEVVTEGLSIEISPPSFAGVSGVIRDANTLRPISGATATVTGDDGTVRRATTTAGGRYYVSAPPGRYSIELAADQYEPATRVANVVDGLVRTRNARLAAGKLAVSTTGVSAEVAMGGSVSRAVRITNEGSAPAVVDLDADHSGFTVLGGHDAATASVDLVTNAPGAVTEPKLSGHEPGGGFTSGTTPLLARDHEGLQAPRLPQLAQDEVTLSHSESHEIVNGSSVGCRESDTSVLRTYTPGDFGIRGTFDPLSVTFAVQTLLAEESEATVRLYTLDGEFTYANMTEIGSATVTLRNEFGSWYTVPIDAAGTDPGTTLVVEVTGFGMYLGGNSAPETSPTYAVSPGCGTTEPTPVADLGVSDSRIVLDITGQDEGAGAGQWLDVQPPRFTVDPGETVAAVVTMAGRVDQPGTYAADIDIDTDTPYRVPAVSATMKVPAPLGWGKVTGTVTGAGGPLADAVLFADGLSSDATLRTATDGTYAYWTPEMNGPLDLTISAANHIPAFRTAQVVAGSTTVYDVDLVPR